MLSGVNTPTFLEAGLWRSDAAKRERFPGWRKATPHADKPLRPSEYGGPGLHDRLASRRVAREDYGASP
jgi:hypothetical protein